MPQAITVILCTRNRAASLRPALKSILDAQPHRLIVVDQSTDEESRRVVEEFGSDLFHYIHTDTPGLSRAYNLGIAASETELLAFTDDDCVVPKGWLASIACAFAEAPAASLIYGQVVAGRIPLQPGDYIPILPFTTVRRFSPGDRFEVFGMGANFAARKTDLLAVGGFDEALGGGAKFRSSQDSDMQLRLWRSGRTVLAHPGFYVEHFGVRTPTQWPATARAYGFGDGAFLIKHLQLRDRTAARLLVSRLLHEAAVPIWRCIKRRSYSPQYAVGLTQGIFAGLGRRVDRTTRKYLLDG